MAWSKYEEAAWRDIQERKRRWYEQTNADSWQHRAGERISGGMGKAQRAAKKLPGVDRVSGAFGAAATKFQEALTDLASRTISADLLLKAYAKRGVEAESLHDLRSVELKLLDDFVHGRRLPMLYGGIALVEGAAAGAVVTGGEALTTFGSTASAGVAAAPGFGTVAATMAGDAALLLTLCSRAVADTAMHYGFDPNAPDEQLFMMSVINVGSALTQSAKYTALADLSKLTQALVRGAPWINLNQFLVSKIAGKFAKEFGVRLTKQKLGQLVPIVGIGVGAALNYATVRSVQEAAYWAYRERLLLEKNPPAVRQADEDLKSWTSPAADAEAEPAIEVAELLEAAADDERHAAASDGPMSSGPPNPESV